jgi:hypothetical protein
MWKFNDGQVLTTLLEAGTYIPARVAFDGDELLTLRRQFGTTARNHAGELANVDAVVDPPYRTVAHAEVRPAGVERIWFARADGNIVRMRKRATDFDPVCAVNSASSDIGGTIP